MKGTMITKKEYLFKVRINLLEYLSNVTGKDCTKLPDLMGDLMEVTNAVYDTYADSKDKSDVDGSLWTDENCCTLTMYFLQSWLPTINYEQAQDSFCTILEEGFENDK